MNTRLKNRLGEDLERLVRAIGDCKSKSEEDRILFRAIESTKASVKNGQVDKQKTRDFLIKLLYFEMLGHDSSFGHFLAVQACGSNVVMTKLTGYLAVEQFLDSSDSLILLLVNTWRTDLQNDNHLIVSAALSAVCKLVNSDAIGALIHQVVALTSHSREGVRKKAVMAIHRFCQIDPKFEGGLAGIDINAILRKTLCDKEPSVMAATLCAIYELAKLDPYPYRNLVPSLNSILKQVVEHRLSRTYEYHQCPAPFIQIRLLRIMALLGAGDKPSTDNMRNTLLSVVKHANPRNTIGFAVLFECLRTITTVSPDNLLLETAAKAIFIFLRSENSHNLKYIGLDALGGMVGINFRQAQEHQTAVMDCLEDPDDTLKLKTLELLYKMTKATNVEIVVEKLVGYLQICTDEHVVIDICQKIGDLAERYAPDTVWYVETMIEMFEAAGDAALAKPAHSLMKLISEQDEEIQKAVVEICLKLLDKSKLPRILLQVVCWVLGEYGGLAGGGLTPITVQEKLCEMLQTTNADEELQGYVLTALTKLAAFSGQIAVDAEDLVKKAISSKAVDLQQRAMELKCFTEDQAHVAQIAMPYNASSQDLTDQMDQIRSLSFLNYYIREALQKGAASYVPESDRDGFAVSLTAIEASGVSSGLRYDAYEAPALPKQAVEAPPPVPDVPRAIPEVSMSALPTPSNELRLPMGKSRRWGPVQPETPDPPVIHLNNVKVEYGAHDQDTDFGSTPMRNGSAELSDRDVLKASLFGEGTPNSTGRGTRFSSRPTKSPEKKAKSPVQPPQTGIDLLDLSDPAPPAAPSADPFAGVDLINGVNGTGTDTPPVQQQAQPVQLLDLDSLYDQNPVMTNFAPAPKMNPTLSSYQTTIPTTSMPTFNPQTRKTKDDPFKDLFEHFDLVMVPSTLCQIPRYSPFNPCHRWSGPHRRPLSYTSRSLYTSNNLVADRRTIFLLAKPGASDDKRSPVADPDAPVPPFKAKEVTEDTWKEEVLNSSIPVFVDFWAPWCGPCKLIGPTIDELVDEFGDKLKIVKVNTDKNSVIATDLGIRSIPTCMIFKDGKRVDTVIGAVPKQALKRSIEKFVN